MTRREEGPGAPKQQTPEPAKVGTLPKRTDAATPTVNTAVATRPRQTLEEQKIGFVQDRLGRGVFLRQLSDVLPAHIKPEAMVRAALLMVTTRGELLDCTPESIANSVLQISYWGLEIGRTAHIVAYGSIAQAQMDWKGLIERARRARAISHAYTHLIYEGDEIEIEYGLERRLVHKPQWRNAGSRLKIGAYSVVKLPDGAIDFEVMNAEEILAIKARSKAGKAGKGPWATDEGEMWRKTVLRRHFKRIPQAAELAEDDDEERLEKLRVEAERVASGVAARARPDKGRFQNHVSTVGDRTYGQDTPGQAALAPGAAPEPAPGAGQGEQAPAPIAPQAGAQAAAKPSSGLAAQPDAYTSTLEAEDRARAASTQGAASTVPTDPQGYPLVQSDESGVWREMDDAERQAYDLGLDRDLDRQRS